MHKLLQDICFLHPALTESHKACFDWWEELEQAGGLTKAYNEFYCIGTINRCHGELFQVIDRGSGEVTRYRAGAPEIELHKKRGTWVDCGCEWWGVFAEDEVTGEMIKGRCPRCGNEYQAQTLQEHQWWQAITGIIATETRNLRDFAAKISSDWSRRLTKVIQGGRLFTYEWAPGLQNYLNRAEALRNYLREAGLEDGENEDATFPKELYDEVNWVVIAPDAFVFLGWDSWEDDTAAWSQSKRRQTMPLLWDALRNKCEGKPAPAPITDIMDEDKPVRFAERIKQARDRVHANPRPEPYQLTYNIVFLGGTRHALVPLPDDRSEAEWSIKGLRREGEQFDIMEVPDEEEAELDDLDVNHPDGELRETSGYPEIFEGDTDEGDGYYEKDAGDA